MSLDSVLRIVDQGAWTGGTVLDNSIYENTGMFFKGGIPVTDESIQQRVGVRTRVVAPDNEKIGGLALEDLFGSSDVDFSRTKVVIGATNIGEGRHSRGPRIRHAMDLIAQHCPRALAFDLYAGCPGFNASVDVLFALSCAGVLASGDVSIIVGAENVHRAQVFKPGDTSNIIFGDDAMATALETTTSLEPNGRYSCEESRDLSVGAELESSVAEALHGLLGESELDGLIVDNQLGSIEHRVPASAARIQHRLVELRHPEEAAAGTFDRVMRALDFYDRHVQSFAFDIMSLDGDPEVVKMIARAFVESGRMRTVASVVVQTADSFRVAIHRGEGFTFHRPQQGIIDASTRTHGCFAGLIEMVEHDDDLWGEMNGKGVFLYATRGAVHHLSELLSTNGQSLDDVDLLIEHQANFAMIPITLERLFEDRGDDTKRIVAEWIADRMVTNIHTRGNTSVVCMQRLPFDLQRGALEEDVIQGYTVNRNLGRMRSARTILYDSVGAGMMRSSFLEKR